MSAQLGIRVRRQRGAATLIAAVLLLSVVVVALSLSLLNANTDITDTALQGDGVEALFIAESGLENAIWRFDNGTACGALALSDSVGRGSFSINNGTAAGLPATQCRVQVTGVVPQAIGTGLQGSTARTIEAVITQATTGGTVSLSNPGFQNGACLPGPDNWTLAANWTGNVCNAWVIDASTNGTRVLYSVVTGGPGAISTTTATQAISCTTAIGDNTVFTVSWQARYVESDGGAGGQKRGQVFFRVLDSLGNPFTGNGPNHNTNTNPAWLAESDTISVPAGRTLVSLELWLATWDRATVQLWVDNVSITRSSGPGCEVAAQPLTWVPVPRP